MATNDDDSVAAMLIVARVRSQNSREPTMMIPDKPSARHPSLELVATMLRTWAVGFVFAAKGTAWLARKMFHARSSGR